MKLFIPRHGDGVGNWDLGGKRVLQRIVDICNWLETGSGTVETEILGEFYQHYCEDARKGRALVQTPNFVRSLILDKTLGEVLGQWGPVAVKAIDPTCGCGFFLTDIFRRTFAAWMGLPAAERRHVIRWNESDREEAVVAQIVLDQIYGVDLDPVCVAIARIRLLFEAWQASDLRMPYRIHVHQGDTLLHHRPLDGDEEKYGPWDYDVEAVRRVLSPNQYTVVVGNPPYITVKDRKLSQAYRDRYPTCHRQYSLAVPFMEVFFGLALKGRGRPEEPVIHEEQGVLFV